MLRVLSKLTRRTFISIPIPKPSAAMDYHIAQPSPDKIQVLPHNQYHSFDFLTPSTTSPSPIDQFKEWFTEVVNARVVPEPETMCVSTCSPSGIPSSRFVLFKQLDARGFIFYTNYSSRKSQELLANPHAALAFYWREVHRSVRVVGKVEKVSREESEAYFKSRPVGSQLGAWASRQSSVVGEGEVLSRLEKIKDRFGVEEGTTTDHGIIPTPEFWGGWRIVPFEVEFWSGKPSRLHDRVRYTRDRTDDGSEWKIERLAP
ncbi:pyridoxamine 5'-phosphate oxidase [Pleurotus eryngii]|uniref:pyridoxal 5'-phosphate synthase n=1 Tax=Pleurotus eryngii TaxID=5323 RepID=A0A9P6DI82_PLEER|nr:pyridoxamine 5'-phosphate oxidase [Pleurotus eryngii]